MTWVSRCIKAMLWEVNGCTVNEWRKLLKAFIRLLEEVVERIKRETEKVIYDVKERDIVIVCVIEDIEEAFKG